jgi:hypothetical protein
MMLRRYADAIRTFSHILVYVSRTKNFQKNSQFDSVSAHTRRKSMVLTASRSPRRTTRCTL